MVNMLQLKNVTVSYKNVPTVQNFNLDMKQGQIVSLVGESGSGKTTVIRAVLGLLAGGGVVSGGSITFEGKDLLSYNREEWRNLRGSEISMIFQDSGAMMNPTRKVGDVFVEYLRTHEKISKKDAWAKGCGMLEKMNLPSPDNVMKSYPFQRYAPACGNRDGYVLSAETAACGRTDLRTGCDNTGTDRAPDDGTAR